MSQAQQFPHQGSSAHAAALELAAALLPVWGFPPGTDIALADAQGVNNQTFLVRRRQRRYVLRVTGFLSVAEVTSEHRILWRLRQSDLPFRVPEPVAAPNGQTVIETPAGPATLCRWEIGRASCRERVFVGV